MDILLIAVGTSMPNWVNAGFAEYAKRLPRECTLKLVEIPAAKRVANVDIARIMRGEGEKMLAAIPRGALVIALDADGKQCSSEELAVQLDQWRHAGCDVALLVGGPEGLAPECRAAATQRWSLSRLTLPHPLVRVVIAEQLYRASTILQGHPYHK